MASADSRGGNNVIKRLLVLGLVATVFSPLTAFAQNYFDPGLFQRTVLQTPEDFEPPGARLGSFMLLPGVDLAWVNNDNVFYTPDNEESDNVFHVRPYADLRSDWNRHSLNFNAWADLAYHQDFDENDYEDWAVRADGRLDVKQNNWFSADVSYFHLHEDRRTPDAQGPATPTEFDYGGFGFGYDHIFNRLKLGAYYNRNSFDYDDNVTLEGDFIDNSFRDRDQDRVTLRGDYQLGPETTIFGTYAWNEIDYDITPDAQGVVRDSDGFNVSAGVAWDMTDLLTGDININYSEQNYDDPVLLDVDGFGVGAGLTWTPRPTTNFNFRLAASPQETAQVNTSGYFSQLFSMRWQEELRQNLLFNLRGSLTDNDYENPGISENELSSTEVYRVDVGLTYFLNRNVNISGGYSWEDQSSNIADFEYTSNRFFLVLGLTL